MAGNGGSAADAEHIVGELMKGFKLPRKPETDFAEKLISENPAGGASRNCIGWASCPVHSLYE